jgi:hypothetical protein
MVNCQALKIQFGGHKLNTTTEMTLNNTHLTTVIYHIRC